MSDKKIIAVLGATGAQGGGLVRAIMNGFPGADDLGNMFQFKHDFEKEFCGARSVEFSRSLNPKLQTFAQWAEANKDRIPIQ